MFYKSFLAKKMKARFGFALVLALGIASCGSVKAIDDSDLVALKGTATQKFDSQVDIDPQTLNTTKGWSTTIEDAMYAIDSTAAQYYPEFYSNARKRWENSFNKEASYGRIEKNCRNESTRLWERIVNCFSGNGCKRNKNLKSK